MTIDPIKDGEHRGQHHQKLKVCRFDCDTHLWQNLKEISQEMWPAERTQDFHQNMTFDPIKDGTLGAALPKTIGV